MKSTTPLTFSAKATLPVGFRAAGIIAGLKKNRQRDMALFFSDSPATLAGTFTTNQVKAATVRLDTERVANIGMAHGIIVNSGQANACTGKAGMRDAKAMAEHTATQFGIAPELVLVCSTGRIGVPLQMDRIRPGIEKLAGALSPTGGEDAARAIMTTDLVPKRYTTRFIANGRPCRLTGIAKGSGMIQPNMATMLAFLLTDAAIDRRALQKALKAAVDQSFNRITVDADQSTNDTALLLANGRAGNTPLKPGHRDWPAFVAALDGLTFRLAMDMVRDGEGAQKLVTVRVQGARTAADAEAAARSVANSFLVKTSWVGSTPNWGRVMDALGYSPAKVDETKVEIFYDKLLAVQKGLKAGASMARLSKVVAKKQFTLTIDLHLGRQAATVYSCDCTEDYIRINK
ncbi:MAG: bifunctional glutamate N-acetyltransferase/amino-acid acetyltransferase ArgJ [Kiritimatiellae bacterium]|nr:bifunctional glutamate N-acetyltransferase/amino-acid acetyltransferase ArgJ [Kiritimatiellia bacterium]MDD4342439.1 bifunctional glutamate N-acetyltransferase/amino-acid acetyltransferase ArgJ [Kiritimatiellia bacterium]